MQHNVRDQLASLVCKKDLKINHKLVTFFKADEGPWVAYVGNKGEHLKTLATDTAAKLAANKWVAKALRLAEGVNVFDVNHQDIKK